MKTLDASETLRQSIMGPRHRSLSRTLRLPFRTAAVLLVASARLAVNAVAPFARLALTAAPLALPKLPTVPSLRLSLPAAKDPLLQAALGLARGHWRWGLAGFVAVSGLMFLMSASLSAAILITLVALGGGAFLARNQ
jgi:hypothetical protein